MKRGWVLLVRVVNEPDIYKIGYTNSKTPGERIEQIKREIQSNITPIHQIEVKDSSSAKKQLKKIFVQNQCTTGKYKGKQDYYKFSDDFLEDYVKPAFDEMAVKPRTPVLQPSNTDEIYANNDSYTYEADSSPPWYLNWKVILGFIAVLGLPGIFTENPSSHTGSRQNRVYGQEQISGANTQGVIDTNSDTVTNLRDSPNGGVITTLQNGTRVSLLGSNSDGTWLKVKTPDGKIGWVYSEFVQEQP